MLLLLDTHILLSLAEEAERVPKFIEDAIRDERNVLFASAVSLWEIAIKYRLRKLPLSCPPAEWPHLLANMAVSIMEIRASHVLADVDPLPGTKDPFDRLLLAICQAENMRFVTLDRALLDHPLTLRPASA